mmetsp:Transcript_1657/g.3906  ORF Transcript_1657/g.3906 Transcript_1657/m.3906 type:complete len:239 (-) Transcript_1657:563-1279(-)
MLIRRSMQEETQMSTREMPLIPPSPGSPPCLLTSRRLPQHVVCVRILTSLHLVLVVISARPAKNPARASMHVANRRGAVSNSPQACISLRVSPRRAAPRCIADPHRKSDGRVELVECAPPQPIESQTGPCSALQERRPARQRCTEASHWRLLTELSVASGVRGAAAAVGSPPRRAAASARCSGVARMAWMAACLFSRRRAHSSLGPDLSRFPGVAPGCPLRFRTGVLLSQVFSNSARR